MNTETTSHRILFFGVLSGFLWKPALMAAWQVFGTSVTNSHDFCSHGFSHCLCANNRAGIISNFSMWSRTSETCNLECKMICQKMLSATSNHNTQKIVGVYSLSVRTNFSALSRELNMLLVWNCIRAENKSNLCCEEKEKWVFSVCWVYTQQHSELNAER